MVSNEDQNALLEVLGRIATALEAMQPPVQPRPDFEAATAFRWHPAKAAPANSRQIQSSGTFEPLKLDALALEDILGVDEQKARLMANTQAFARGRWANHALLWGARGMGKSSLVKSIVKSITDEGISIKLIEVSRAALNHLDQLVGFLSEQPFRYILFCDDFAFEDGDERYRSLKSSLDGSVASRHQNILIYATSNRRHLLSRDLGENAGTTATNPGDEVDERISLSDRFGLWLGFPACDQATYLSIVERHAANFQIALSRDELRDLALKWARTRGARSGRVAYQFVIDLASQTDR
ncbi:MAG: ATP-binding protein [Pseudomonadota bacterium]